MRKKVISWIPLYDTMGFASTRIRLLYPHRSINQFFYEQYDSVIGFQEDADILIVQKKLTDEAVQMVQSSKAKLKIYDYDDPVYNEPNFAAMINSVDLVTTDVKGSKARFDSMNLGKPCIVAEDCLDYGISELLPPAEDDHGLVWFGNAACYGSIHGMVQAGLELGQDIRIISDLQELQNLCPYVPQQVERVMWSPITCVDELRVSSTCILSHIGAEERKSNNKMLVAIAAGLPVIAGPSQSYLELLTQFGLQNFSINNTHDMSMLLDALAYPQPRARYLRDIQPYILDRYSTKNVTANFLKEIDQYA